MKTLGRHQAFLPSNRVHAVGRRLGLTRVPSGRPFGSHCSAPSRANFGLRVAWDDVEEFATATVKTSVPTVVWREDFDDLFALQTEVAAGSFGKVWKANEKATGKPVAVKRLQIQRGNLTTEKTRVKVDREVRVLMELQGHPGVVNLHGTFLHDSHYDVVMDFCEGGDLKSHVQASGPISERLGAAVAWEILGAVRKCRQAKVVHGDVKAANFLVASERCNPFHSTDVIALPSGWLKAVDFGASRFFRGRPKDVIRGCCGSPVYMAPEVLWGHYGYEADLWSVGITLFYLMSGRFPLWETEQVALQQNLAQVKEAVARQPMRIDPVAVGNPSPSCMDFLRRLLIRNNKFRMTLEDAEQHPFFHENLAICENGAVILGSNSSESSASKAELCALTWALEGM
ncbi:hypothetical protein BSKO_02234 [Bryopsis sp. KO-2023]|nr:hypothetical protein BSKO_02234 [Bryopsis sp. KO-2023]